MSNKIEKAVAWAESIAKDNSHGYDQELRWGTDFDCSSLIISAYEQAGVPVKRKGATYTGNMKKVFLNNGFVDVTNEVDLKTGKGAERGDVLLNELHHTAMYVGAGNMVHAGSNENGKAKGGKKGDQTGREICVRTYYNYPWDCVLRYVDQEPKKETNTTAAKNTSTKKTASNTTDEPKTEYKAKGVAKYFDKNVAGTYKTTADLNMRHGAGTSNKIMITLPEGTKVQCYGYYSTVNKSKWLYVVAKIGNSTYTGFCSSSYLIK